MSIYDSCTLQTASAAETTSAGLSLAASLYRTRLTVDLVGEMGGGKTTFVQGFAEGLGMKDRPVSPTFALEQRYGDRLCHIDLCRLEPKEASRLLHHSDDFPGIRMIEWADKSDTHTADIHISFEDHRMSRGIRLEFADVPIPTDEDIATFIHDVMLPPHIQKHMEAVERVSEALAADCLRRGIIVRPRALRAAAKLHDLFRFVDFKSLDDSGFESPPTEKEKARWMELKNKYALRHEPSAARYLEERGFAELGKIVVSHRGAESEHTPLPQTIEQKLLCYADKRVDFDRLVTLQERFAGLIERHKKSPTDPKELAWQKYIRQLEHELFPDGPPL